MNSVANGKVVLNTPFKKVYVQSAAGDAGGAIGAALTTWYKVGKDKAKQRVNIDPAKLIELVEMVRANEKWGWLTASAFCYGTRSGETFSLIPDLDSGTATSVCIPKGKKSMYIKYPIALTKELDELVTKYKNELITKFQREKK